MHDNRMDMIDTSYPKICVSNDVILLQNKDVDSKAKIM